MTKNTASAYVRAYVRSFIFNKVDKCHFMILERRLVAARFILSSLETALAEELPVDDENDEVLNTVCREEEDEPGP